jgi:hypothetical protein
MSESERPEDDPRYVRALEMKASGTELCPHGKTRLQVCEACTEEATEEA